MNKKACNTRPEIELLTHICYWTMYCHLGHAIPNLFTFKAGLELLWDPIHFQILYDVRERIFPKYKHKYIFHKIPSILSKGNINFTHFSVSHTTAKQLSSFSFQLCTHSFLSSLFMTTFAIINLH